MKILSVEFSSETRSVALVENGRLLGHASEVGGRTARAFALIKTALGEAGLEREAIECIAVGLGPGSYAGIRAAIALAQGWQLAQDVRVLGVNSVEVLAAQAHAELPPATLDAQPGQDPEPLLSRPSGTLSSARSGGEGWGEEGYGNGVRGTIHFLIDAQRNEFYLGRAEPGGTARIAPLRLIGSEEAHALPTATLIVEPALLKQFPGARAMCPDATALGRLAATRSDFVSADTLEPIYLRATSFVKAPPPRVIPN